jgi:hypothetical protein
MAKKMASKLKNGKLSEASASVACVQVLARVVPTLKPVRMSQSLRPGK